MLEEWFLEQLRQARVRNAGDDDVLADRQAYLAAPVHLGEAGQLDQLRARSPAHGYQRMPVAELFTIHAVTLRDSLAMLRGQAGVCTPCIDCGEEILNGRGVSSGGITRCRSCAAGGYYRPLP